VFICVDGVFMFLFFHFHISIIFINLSNKLAIINLRSKEINQCNKIFQHNTRSIVVNYSSGISMVVCKSYWYQISFLLGICGKLQDLGIGLRRKLQDPGIGLRRKLKNPSHGE